MNQPNNEPVLGRCDSGKGTKSRCTHDATIWWRNRIYCLEHYRHICRRTDVMFGGAVNPAPYKRSKAK